jgi:DNA-binding NarL/FixJ family response regulator
MAKTILIAVKDLLFGSKIQEATKRTQTAVSWASRFERLRDEVEKKAPEVLVADLGDPGNLDEIAAVKAARPDLRVVGFLGHAAEDAIARAREIGVDEIFTKGQFSAQVDRILVRERGDG